MCTNYTSCAEQTSGYSSEPYLIGIWSENRCVHPSHSTPWGITPSLSLLSLLAVLQNPKKLPNLVRINDSGSLLKNDFDNRTSQSKGHPHVIHSAAEEQEKTSTIIVPQLPSQASVHVRSSLHTGIDVCEQSVLVFMMLALWTADANEFHCILRTLAPITLSASLDLGCALTQSHSHTCATIGEREARKKIHQQSCQRVIQQAIST